ncbi:unnamed protein product [Periconia digitata]|uniref:Uncharacterized protein n=1 Tax=Periconia digitata TaxID=1303443 RepID=A0A9W4UVF5_9PLEO|nr:unnamed protein product [Periconia digitata]
MVFIISGHQKQDEHLLTYLFDREPNNGQAVYPSNFHEYIRGTANAHPALDPSRLPFEVNSQATFALMRIELRHYVVACGPAERGGFCELSRTAVCLLYRRIWFRRVTVAQEENRKLWGRVCDENCIYLPNRSAIPSLVVSRCARESHEYFEHRSPRSSRQTQLPFVSPSLKFVEFPILAAEHGCPRLLITLLVILDAVNVTVASQPVAQIPNL